MDVSSTNPLKEFPYVLVDPRSGTTYTRGSFIERGGFGNCYEVTDERTKQVFACKILSKSLIRERNATESEIAIHESLSHRHIVGFHSSFEDKDFVYVILELCRRESLRSMQMFRRAVTEPEARYLMRQLFEGVQYLHGNMIIHRDLKLDNIFLSEDMEVKIGDFGLATKVEFEGQWKKTWCGTPNFMAPEVLQKKFYSYEVDTWSLGCILYTLLVGSYPFQASCVEETFNKIQRNDYYIPSSISPAASALIGRMLCEDPDKRPTIAELEADDFFTAGYTPPHLLATCLYAPPKFSEDPSNSMELSQRHPATTNSKVISSERSLLTQTRSFIIKSWKDLIGPFKRSPPV